MNQNSADINHKESCLVLKAISRCRIRHQNIVIRDNKIVFILEKKIISNVITLELKSFTVVLMMLSSSCQNNQTFRSHRVVLYERCSKTELICSSFIWRHGLMSQQMKLKEKNHINDLFLNDSSNYQTSFFCHKNAHATFFSKRLHCNATY